MLIPEQSASEPQFDVASLFLHLLLFETVIVPTLRLKDIAAVIRCVGYAQTMELLASGCLTIRAAIDQIGYANSPDPTVVKLLYIWSDRPDMYLSRYFESFADLGLKKPD